MQDDDITFGSICNQVACKVIRRDLCGVALTISYKQNMQKQILIIDDDEDMSFIISEMLESYGYGVNCAHNSEKAFELLSENTYHLILLDINLPDTTGFEFCRELRRVSDVPVIFASARTSESDRITGFDIGGDDYLPKPYSMKELLSRVNALIRRTYGFFEKEKIVKFGNISVNLTEEQSRKTVKKCPFLSVKN